MAAAAPLAAGLDDAGVKPTPRAWTWAALMHRAFAIDVLACPHCGGRLRLIATLHDPAVIRTRPVDGGDVSRIAHLVHEGLLR
jgi:hypothetical protein